MIAKRKVETGDSILLQPVDTVAVNQALAGKSGDHRRRAISAPKH